MPRRTDGSVFQDKATGGWIAKLTVNGRDKRRRAATQQAAIRLLAAMRRERDAGLDLSRLTVADYLDQWLERKRHDGTRVNTLRSYESKIRAHLAPLLGHHVLVALTPANVEDATGVMVAAGSSGRNAAHVRVVLANALHDAERRGLVARNVAQLARAPRVETVPRKALDAQQVMRLLQALEGHEWAPVYALAATLALRQGEILALRWSDIADDELRVQRTVRRVHGKAVYEPPKNASSRRPLPVLPPVAALLRATRARQNARRLQAGPLWQDEALVFAGPVGASLNPDDVRDVLYDALLRAELPRVTFHDLRHSANSIMAAIGVPVHVRAAILGHAHVATTQDVYTHILGDEEREAVARLWAAMGRA